MYKYLYTTYISVDFAYYQIYRAKVGINGGRKGRKLITTIGTNETINWKIAEIQDKIIFSVRHK